MGSASQKIVICATQRCGSTLLCNDLANNGLGRPEEHFLGLINNYEANQHLDLMPNILQRGTSGTGIFAVKIMANYAPAIDRYLAARAGPEQAGPHLQALAAQFSGAYWVWMTRRDLVAQAVSQLMSRITGVNHAIVDRQDRFVPGKAMLGASESYNENVSIPDSQITATVIKIAHENKAWEVFFDRYGITPHRVAYEDILDGLSHVQAIRNDLGLATDEIVNKRNLVKLGNRKSQEIVQNYNLRRDKRMKEAAAEVHMAAGTTIDVAAVQEVSKRWIATPYYDAVETMAGGQWLGLISPFLNPHADIDYGHVLEIAVGHGRMTQLLLNTAGQVTGVDVLQENIDFCANRFKDNGRLRLIKTDGATLKEIADGSVSFMFCFDSMVHFDSDVVRSYIRESRRVLKPGGYFFTHHSNNTRSPEGDFKRTPHARNFMSEPLFRHYAHKEGMDVAATKVIDWGSGDKHVPKLDCLSLLRRRPA